MSGRRTQLIPNQDTMTENRFNAFLISLSNGFLLDFNFWLSFYYVLFFECIVSCSVETEFNEFR